MGRYKCLIGSGLAGASCFVASWKRVFVPRPWTTLRLPAPSPQSPTLRVPVASLPARTKLPYHFCGHAQPPGVQDVEAWCFSICNSAFMAVWHVGVSIVFRYVECTQHSVFTTCPTQDSSYNARPQETPNRHGFIRRPIQWHQLYPAITRELFHQSCLSLLGTCQILTVYRPYASIIFYCFLVQNIVVNLPLSFGSQRLHVTEY